MALKIRTEFSSAKLGKFRKHIHLMDTIEVLCPVLDLDLTVQYLYSVRIRCTGNTVKFVMLIRIRGPQFVGFKKEKGRNFIFLSCGTLEKILEVYELYNKYLILKQNSNRFKFLKQFMKSIKNCNFTVLLSRNYLFRIRL